MHNAKLQLVRKRIGRHTSCLLGHFIYEQSLSLQGHKLDLGCGPVKLPGHIGLDKIDLEPVDIVADLENGHLPFEDESFDVVYSSNTLEHIENINVVMAEVYRILKKNGHFLISVPYAGSIKAFQDPTHRRFFTFNTFDYFVEQQNVAPKWYFRTPFKRIARKKYTFARSPLNLIIGPIINSSCKIQAWYENSMLRLVSPEALEVDIIK